MKSLPKNICAHPDGLLVRVKRGAVLLQAFVPGNDPGALLKARWHVARFIALAGEAKKVKQAVRSNTGVAGVSETTMWRGNYSYPCFIVGWSLANQRGMKRFVYGRGVDRRTALRSSIALRAAKAGEDFAALLAQSELGGAS